MARGGRSYVLRLIPGKVVSNPFEYVEVSKWQDPLDSDSAKYGHSSTSNLRRYFEWTFEVSMFLQSLPLQYKSIDASEDDYRPFCELWASNANAHNIDYLIESLLNCGANRPLNPEVDDLRLENVLDSYIYGVLSTRLSSKKQAVWTSSNDMPKVLRTKTGNALKALISTYLGEKHALRERQRNILMRMYWKEDTTLHTLKVNFFVQLSLCRRLGILLDFDSVMTAWMNAVQYRRLGSDRFANVLNISEVRNAIMQRNIAGFIVEFCRYLSTYLIHSDGRMPYNEMSSPPHSNSPVDDTLSRSCSSRRSYVAHDDGSISLRYGYNTAGACRSARRRVVHLKGSKRAPRRDDDRAYSKRAAPKHLANRPPSESKRGRDEPSGQLDLAKPTLRKERNDKRERPPIAVSDVQVAGADPGLVRLPSPVPVSVDFVVSSPLDVKDLPGSDDTRCAIMDSSHVSSVDKTLATTHTSSLVMPDSRSPTIRGKTYPGSLKSYVVRHASVLGNSNSGSRSFPDLLLDSTVLGSCNSTQCAPPLNGYPPGPYCSNDIALDASYLSRDSCMNRSSPCSYSPGSYASPGLSLDPTWLGRECGIHTASLLVDSSPGSFDTLVIPLDPTSLEPSTGNIVVSLPQNDCFSGPQLSAVSHRYPLAGSLSADFSAYSIVELANRRSLRSTSGISPEPIKRHLIDGLSPSPTISKTFGSNADTVGLRSHPAFGLLTSKRDISWPTSCLDWLIERDKLLQFIFDAGVNLSFVLRTHLLHVLYLCDADLCYAGAIVWCISLCYSTSDVKNRRLLFPGEEQPGAASTLDLPLFNVSSSHLESEYGLLYLKQFLTGLISRNIVGCRNRGNCRLTVIDDFWASLIFAACVCLLGFLGMVLLPVLLSDYTDAPMLQAYKEFFPNSDGFIRHEVNGCSDYDTMDFISDFTYSTF